MSARSPVPQVGPPPRRRPSGCLLIALCLVSTVLLVFGGCCVILSSEIAKTAEDWLIVGIPSLAIVAVGLLCARGAWRMYRRWKAARPAATRPETHPWRRP